MKLDKKALESVIEFWIIILTCVGISFLMVTLCYFGGKIGVIFSSVFLFTLFSFGVYNTSKEVK